MSGNVSPCPEWIGQDFSVAAFFVYEEAIPFTRESWRGRIRACRAIGAELSFEETEKFDKEHAQLLERIAPEEFTVLHRIDAHILSQCNWFVETPLVTIGLPASSIPEGTSGVLPSLRVSLQKWRIFCSLFGAVFAAGLNRTCKIPPH
ncbi:MAG: hypothetical protein WBQ34_16975 [Candidatus Acidiferrales bacterium]